MMTRVVHQYPQPALRRKRNWCTVLSKVHFGITANTRIKELRFLITLGPPGDMLVPTKTHASGSDHPAVYCAACGGRVRLGAVVQAEARVKVSFAHCVCARHSVGLTGSCHCRIRVDTPVSVLRPCSAYDFCCRRFHFAPGGGIFASRACQAECFTLAWPGCATWNAVPLAGVASDGMRGFVSLDNFVRGLSGTTAGIGSCNSEIC
jgi:hypothetical protein